jgi:hypothetical protein
MHAAYTNHKSASNLHTPVTNFRYKNDKNKVSKIVSYDADSALKRKNEACQPQPLVPELVSYVF